MVDAAPTLTVFAGPNGSGKSTLQGKIVSEKYDLGPFINADVIELELRFRDADAGVPAKADDWYQRAAFDEATDQREESLKRGCSFSFETVFSHESKIDFLKRAKAAGYIVRLYFIGTENSRLNVARVSYRVRAGGHNVATQKIIERYRRALALLPSALDHVDECIIFDNSDIMRAVVSFKRTAGGTGEFVLSRSLPRWVAAVLWAYADRRRE